MSVRLLVAAPGAPLIHARFADLPRHLAAGDLLVVNESATIPAAVPALRDDGSRVQVHFSTPHPEGGDAWLVELRRDGRRVTDGRPGERLSLPGGAGITLTGTEGLALRPRSPGTDDLSPRSSLHTRGIGTPGDRGPGPPSLPGRDGGPGPVSRLWVARLELGGPVMDYLARHGAPITYAHDPVPRPLSEHQTIFSRVPGSAEMPSAGRPFTHRTLHALAARGVGVAGLVLHTGVSSLERGERPYPERYAVPPATAARVNATRRAGGRVIAVGTTVTRALETVAAPGGTVRPGSGWTDLVLTADRGVRVVDGLVTGWHDDGASHLDLLEAVGGPALVAASYAAGGRYRRHERGDSHLLLRRPAQTAARAA